MTDTLILTGWGWKEYAVAAAVVLKALNGNADVQGVSKRRLPELLEGLDAHYKKIVILGVALNGDEDRLKRHNAYEQALKESEDRVLAEKNSLIAERERLNAEISVFMEKLQIADAKNNRPWHKKIFG